MLFFGDSGIVSERMSLPVAGEKTHKAMGEKAKLVCGETRKRQLCIEKQTWRSHVERGRKTV